MYSVGTTFRKYLKVPLSFVTILSKPVQAKQL
jgi:hypothetical protein